MRRFPWCAALADAALTACCVSACINAMPTAYEVPYDPSVALLVSFVFALVLASLIHLAKKKWLLPCGLFAALTALFGFLTRGPIANGAKLLWYSAARLWSLDFSILPTPEDPGILAFPESYVTALLVFAAAVLTLVTAVLVIKPKLPIFALLVPVPAMAPCFIYTDCRPAVFTMVLLAIYIAGVLFGYEIKKKDVRSAGTGKLLFLLLLAGVGAAILIASPQDKFEPIPFAQRRSFIETFGPLRDSIFTRQFSNPREYDLQAEGDRQIEDEKAFSVNCSSTGVFLLRTHSYGRYTGAMWRSASEYQGDWNSLEALGSTQNGGSSFMAIRDAYMSERITPYAFTRREEVEVGESYVRAYGRTAYIWSFKPRVVFEASDPTPDEEEYYKFALREYTLPDGPLKTKLISLLEQMAPVAYKESDGGYRLGSGWEDVFGYDPAADDSSLPLWVIIDGTYVQPLTSSSMLPGNVVLVIDPDRPYLTARNIAKLVRSSGKYTLEPGLVPSGYDFVEYFLNESKRGYCVHFASATAALLQAAGIPARYVVGYRAEVTEADTWVDVPRGASHAWTEVYIKGVGWVPVESTASFSENTGYTARGEIIPDTPSVTPVPDVTLPPVEVTRRPHDPLIPTLEPTARPTRTPLTPTEPTEPAEKSPLGWFIALGAAAAAAALWQGVGAIIRAVRRRRFTQKDSRAAVLEMLRYLGSLRGMGAELPKDFDMLSLEAAFSNHSMENRQKELLEIVERNRSCLMKHSPFMRFVMKWVTFRL